jgi:hypothetical protein
MMRFAFAAVLYLGFAAMPHAQVSPQLAQKAPEAAEIAATAAQDGHVRVIVEFAGPVPNEQLRPDPQVLAPVTAEIAARQNAIIASHFGSATNPREGQGFPRGLVRFSITPTFAVNVSPSELDALAVDPAVLGIYYDHRGSALLPQSVPLIGMEAAYIANATGQRQAVAVLDTGVQTNHVFLSGNVLPLSQACYSNGDGKGQTLCPNGAQSDTDENAANNAIPACTSGVNSICSHGTHVAGIAAGSNTVADALPENGVAKGAKIVPVEVFTRYGNSTGFVESDLKKGLEWVYQNALNPAPGVRLAAVNLSLGFNKKQYPSECDADFKLLKDVVDMLRRAGVVTVAASGNDYIKTLIGSPACISSAVAVGSTDKQDRISGFSSMSPRVNLVAPGGFTFAETACKFGNLMETEGNVNILSSISKPDANDWVNCDAGTSMAAPHVAGAFAAIRTVCPDATVDRISAALQATGKPVEYFTLLAWRTVRRINVDQARQALGCASHDFNGDGKSDLVWRDTAGNTAVWLMSGTQVLSSAGIGAPPLTMAFVGQRDFDGDGKSDLLWRDTSGNNMIWFMDGTAVRSRRQIAPVSTAWSVVGTGDFNASGKGGILWRDTAGNNSLWLVNGTDFAANQLPSFATTWSVAGTGDFDGDGKCDILWRDTAGNVRIWFMDGAQVASDSPVGPVPISYSIIATGDFNGDGRTDIVWRDTAGNLSIWFMNRTTATGVGFGVVPTTFSLAQTGDYNGDGVGDLLWRDAGGATSIWFMNGTQQPSMQMVGIIPTTWTLQALNSN